MIGKIDSNNISKQNNITFTAIPLAKYRYMRNAGSDVFVYQMEKKDIDYLQFLLTNINEFFEKYNIKDESRRQVTQQAFQAGIEILKEEKHAEPKAKILMSFYEDEPSSILIGNALKIDKKGRLHYSSRKNHAKKETELDWLASWNTKIPGEGTITVYEYFITLIKDGFKQLFVRSEILQKSFAQRFYEKMGLTTLSDAPKKLQGKNDYEYLAGKFDEADDEIIPMKATIGDIKRVLEEKKNEVLRKEITNKTSITLEKKL